ncbi:hypothetical protein PUNSTDRAFT_139956 [Punctularia strigosozonata HHB-11173 SS5]|uniref:uncharacterized protein n=1 Tax=Punctularia strigosozonata (strain HHB-11173) TaxID=741275 RepID=UPI000441759B|nr:uncharacterized protein PUNSTDRAFT_139956 [Punctularia strigosozonata HHB-11173 SS5]EIN13403.1 hypothetical protein PUNSTDRAFT_139956 [Punctularia strigosozonata HHB-11173 SS5]
MCIPRRKSHSLATNRSEGSTRSPIADASWPNVLPRLVRLDAVRTGKLPSARNVPSRVTHSTFAHIRWCFAQSAGLKGRLNSSKRTSLSLTERAKSIYTRWPLGRWTLRRRLLPPALPPSPRRQLLHPALPPSISRLRLSKSSCLLAPRYWTPRCGAHPLLDPWRRLLR